MLRAFLRLAGVCLLFYLLTFLTSPPAQAATDDRLSPNHALAACITIAGPLATLPAIQPQAYPGLPQQYWPIDVYGQWHSDADTSYCLARKSSGSWALPIVPCTDTLALRLDSDATNPARYTIIGDSTALG